MALFEVGDKVCHSLWEGEATITDVREGVTYPVKVAVPNRNTRLFTLEGREFEGDSEPTLRHAKTGKPAVIGEPPKRFNYPLYMENLYDKSIFEFVALNEARCVRSASREVEVIKGIVNHTDRSVWTPCSNPTRKPEETAWYWAWDRKATH